HSRNSHSFPTRRSSDLGTYHPNVLIRSRQVERLRRHASAEGRGMSVKSRLRLRTRFTYCRAVPSLVAGLAGGALLLAAAPGAGADRKSTRLNSSHLVIS